MRRSCRSKMFGLVCALAVLTGWGNGFRNPPEGPNALARSGGRTAYIDDASAVTHNPANLVYLDDEEFLWSLTFGYTNHTANRGGSSSSSQDDLKTLPNLWLAIPLPEHDGALGFGLTTPYGQSTSWSKDGVFKYTAPYFSELRLVNINPTYAHRLTPSLSIGVGLDVFASDLTFKQQFPWAAVTGNPASPDGRMKFYGQGEGVGANVALTWQPTDTQRAALTFHSPVKVTYEGDMTITNRPPNSALPPPVRQVAYQEDFETSIQFPARVVAAYGFKPTPSLTIGTDVEWVEFSRYDELDLEVGRNSVLLPSTKIQNDWEDIWTFGFGIDWQASPTWTWRCGYNYLPSPVPDETHSPVIPDADRHVLTVGFAYSYKVHTISLAYAHTIFQSRDVDNHQLAAYNADYELNAHLLSIGYAYSF